MDGPSMLMAVTDAMTFVLGGTESKEEMITNNRDKVKVKVRDNVLMSAVAGQMEGVVRYVPVLFLLDACQENSISDQRTIRNIWLHHPLQ